MNECYREEQSMKELWNVVVEKLLVIFPPVIFLKLIFGLAYSLAPTHFIDNL